MRPIRSLASIFVILSIVSFAGRVHANEDIIQLPLQRAKCLCGIVTYENGDPARGAKPQGMVPQPMMPSPFPSKRRKSSNRETVRIRACL